MSSKEEEKKVAAKKPTVKKNTKLKKEVPEKNEVSEKKIVKEKKEEKAQNAKETSISLKSVTIEACKSWGAFKSRSTKIQKGVGSKAKVEINKEKPGKGNFIVKVSGVEEAIVELKGMKRPFKPLKELDMDDVIEKVLAAI